MAWGWYRHVRPRRLPLVVVGKDKNHWWIQCSYRRHACAWPAKRTHFWPTRGVPPPCRSTQFSVMGVENEELLAGDSLSALHSLGQCISEDHQCTIIYCTSVRVNLLLPTRAMDWYAGTLWTAISLIAKAWQHLLFLAGNSGWFILSPKKQELAREKVFPLQLMYFKCAVNFIFLSMTDRMFRFTNLARDSFPSRGSKRCIEWCLRGLPLYNGLSFLEKIYFLILGCICVCDFVAVYASQCKCLWRPKSMGALDQTWGLCYAHLV